MCLCQAVAWIEHFVLCSQGVGTPPYEELKPATHTEHTQCMCGYAKRAVRPSSSKW